MTNLNPLRTGQFSPIGVLEESGFPEAGGVGPPRQEGAGGNIIRCRWREFPHGKRTRALAVVQGDEDGRFVSFSPSLPGAVSQGGTVEQALENLREAIAGCVESYRAGGERVPWVADPDFQGDAAFRGWIDVDV